MQKITFKSEGHDDFIDFLKGVCILWVVLDHALPLGFKDAILFCLWGDMAVPIFLLVQCVHAYKRAVIKKRIDWIKIWKRIIRPFLIVQAFEFSVGCLTTYILGKDIWEYFFEFMSHGGNGRGSYYPKMYLEFALLIPVMGVVFQRSRWLGGALLLIASSVAEVYFSISDDYLLWQWLCVRYLFLLYLGYIVAKDGIRLNGITILMSFLSAVAILVFYYENFDFSPIFYDNPWRIYRWPSYIYVAFLLIFILFKLQQHMPRPFKIYFMKMGRASYEIFLFQMLVFCIFDKLVNRLLVNHDVVFELLYSLFATASCIIPVLVYKDIKSKCIFSDV